MNKPLFTILKQTPFDAVAQMVTDLYQISGERVICNYSEMNSLNALRFAATRPRKKKQIMAIMKSNNWKYTEFLCELDERHANAALESIVGY